MEKKRKKTTVSPDITIKTPINKSINRNNHSPKKLNLKDQKGRIIGAISSGYNVNELEKLRQQLKESETKYYATFDATSSAIVSVDAGGIVIEYNRAAARMLGVGQKDMVGKPFIKAMAGGTGGKAMARLKIIIQRGYSYGGEYKLRKKDGTIIDVIISSTAVKDDSGRFLRTISVLEDVTQRKYMEEMLKESEEKYRAIFNSSNDAVFVHQPLKSGKPSRFIAVNQVACERLGYTLQELLKMTPADIHADKNEKFVEENAKKLLKDKYAVFKTRHLLKSGAIIPVEVHARVFDLQGVPTVVASAHDISGSIAAENAMKEQARYKELRAQAWKLAADKTLDENTLIQGLIDRLGPATGSDRITYSRIEGGRISTVCEWKNAGARGTSLGISAPAELLEKMDIKGQSVIDSESIIRLVPGKLRPVLKSLIRMIAKRQGDNPGLATVCYINGKKEGVITCALKRGSVEIWPEEVRSIISEVAQIISRAIEQRRAQETLRESEQKYRALFENSNDAVFVHQPLRNGTLRPFIAVNKAACDRLGYSEEELLKMTPSDISSPETRVDPVKSVKNMFKVGWTHQETVHMAKNGRKIPVEINARMIEMDGTPTVVTSVRDITDRKLAAEKEKKNAAISAARTEIWRIASEPGISQEKLANGLISTVGPAAGAERMVFGLLKGKDLIMEHEWRARKDVKKFSGFKLPGFIFENFTIPDQEIVSPRTLLEKAPAIVKNLLKPLLYGIIKKYGDSPSLVTTYYVSGKRQGIIICSPEKGKQIWLDEEKSLVSEAAKIVSRVMSQRIAEKKQLESERLYRAFFTNANDGILVQRFSLKPARRPDTTIIDFNDKVCEIFDMKREEMQGSAITDFIGAAGVEKVRSTMKELFSGGTLTNIMALKTKKGSAITAEVRSSVFDFGESKILLNVIRDITDRAKAEEALKESEERFRTAFVTSPDSVNINRLSDGMFVEINEGFTRVTGYKAKDVEGRTSRDINIWNNPDDRQRMVGELNKKGFADNFEAVFRMKSGALKTGLMSARIISIKGVPHILSITRDISERIRAQEAIRESEEKFRNVVSQTGQLVYDFDIHSGTIKWAGAIKELTGYEPEEFNREVSLDVWGEMIHPDDRVKAYELLEDSQKKCGKYNAEYRFHSKDGSYRYMLDEGIFIAGEDGKANRMLGVMKDITERRKAEETIRESEERFRVAFMTSPDAMIISRVSDGRLLDANEGYQKVTGYTREEAVNKTSFDAGIWKNKDDRAAYMKTLKEKGRVENYELEFLKKDGAVISAMVSAAIIRIHGEPCIIAVARDMSERKAAENALKESEEKFRTLSEQSLLGINILQEGKFKYYNQAFLRMTGFSAKDMETMDERAYARYIHPDDVHILAHRTVEEGTPGASNSYQFRIIRKSGEIRWLDVYSRNILFEGKQANFITTADITGLKETEEKLNRSITDLLRSNAELESFAYVASHDLQEPLRMVSSYVQLLKRRYGEKLGQDADDFIGYAVDGADRMQKLIKDLLAYSRVGSAKKEYTPVDFKDIIETAKVNMAETINEKMAEITFGSMPVVMADELQMLQLVQNLLSNSLKFSRKDEVPRINITSQKEGNNWIFAFQDNGIGIDKAYFEKVFVIFQRLHGKSEYPGTGIGLAICKKIVEYHSGKIWLESEEGKGATFYFSLPAGKNRGYK